MSLVFSDTSTFKGIIQIYEKEIGANRGDVSGDSNRLKEVTADVNLALDEYLSIAFKASGTWQFDDSNHTDYPIITANLVDGQRDYSFTVDGNSNLILDIHRVLILPSATATLYSEVYPRDVQSGEISGISENNLVEGVPYTYDKTANGIFFDPIPSYNATSGLKIYINREGSYFTSSDTTKKPGVPGNHHKYFAIKPAMEYARIKGLSSYVGLRDEVLRMEKQIEEDFTRRERDVRKIMTPKRISFI